MRVEKGDGERDERRVMSLPEFCARYGIGRSKAYLEIQAKRLRGHKCGDRVLIATDDAEEWLRSLPVMGAADGQSACKRKRVS